MGTVNIRVAKALDDAYQPAGGAVTQGQDLYLGRTFAGHLTGAWRFVLPEAIPAGAVIHRCVLSLVQNGERGAEDATLYLRASLERAAAPGDFSGTAILSRTKTNATAVWTLAAPAYQTAFATPDLAASLQEVVDALGAVSAIVVFAASEAGNTATTQWVNAAPYENPWSFPAPLLTIEYTAVATTTPTATEGGTVPRTVTSTGAKVPDTVRTVSMATTSSFRVADPVQQTTRIGSLSYLTRLGTLQQITRMGSLADVVRLGTLQQATRIGSLSYLTRLGTLAQVTRIGSLASVTRLGTLQQATRIGSLSYLTRIGTLAQVTRIGSLTQVTRVGSLTQAARMGSMGRQLGGSVFRANVPLGPGSTWIGSWQDVRPYRLKTVAVQTLGGTPSGNGGSLSVVVGLTGTGVNHLTGTYHGPALIMRGSYTTYTVTDAVGYLRVFYRQSGYRRGTLSIGFARRT